MVPSQKKISEKKDVPCPECDNPIAITLPSPLSTVVECDSCGTESEIINLDPFQLAPLEEEK